MKDFFRIQHTIEVIEVPSGKKNLLPLGTEVRITQNLGSAITVATKRGYLCRIEGPALDAIDPAFRKQAESRLRVDSTWPVEKQVEHLLRTVYDPEITLNLLDLGLIYERRFTRNPNGGFDLKLVMTLTSPTCGMSDVLKSEIEQKLSTLSQLKHISISLVFSPPWDRSRMSPAARLALGLD